MGTNAGGDAAVAWTSVDGTDWQLVASPTFGQGEMLAVAADPGRVVAVGTFGAPDNYAPTVWISPPGR